MASKEDKLINLGHLKDTAERIDAKFIDEDELASVQQANDDKFIDADELQAVQNANDEKFIDVDELAAVNTKLEQALENKVSVEMDFAHNTLIFTTT